MNRLSYDEGVYLFKNGDLETLKMKAQEVRNQKNPPNRVTFVLDSNPNYTNVCNVDCTFCAFYRHKGAKDAYTKSVSEVMQHMERAKRAGLTTVLLQGGVNPELKIDYYVDLIKAARANYPDIHPHFFTAVELWQCAQISNLTIEEVLQKLWDAGQRTLPGGGAEILSEKVRLEISPKKMGPNGWINTHRAAHKIGFRTTATMMYGHVEEPEDIVTHLETIRAAQDEIPGFTSFIPWSYKRDRTALRRKVKHWSGGDHYFRILAFARLYLDNFDHIGASWFGEGKEIGIQSLHYGADDFGGTIMEENVHRATKWVNRADHNTMLQMIRRAGFEPAQRDTLHNIVRTYEGIESVDIPEEQKIKEEDNLPPLGIFAEEKSCCKG
ncbi:MAG: Cyclic dehypoxanthine futalosine synthase [Chlamydiales bacterium]|nr:Cyclic dehypoxanthine futalosine synthase [Chlamydiales bacterium]MCH9619875.1 Cyclic dehypoxanthine futalosine synthase [Chlamydiales bacterium]MCH9622698.1 Cyclic dehypoxanthine futalosine synthase [Chlamydiales bacterium]